MAGGVTANLKMKRIQENKIITFVFGLGILILLALGGSLLREPHGALLLPGLTGSIVLFLVAFIVLKRQLRAHGRVEEALRESEDRYKHLVDYANDIIYKTDENGHIIFANPTASRVLGYFPEELLGRSYLEISRHDYRDSVSRFYRTQSEKKTPNTYYELPVITRDSRELWLGQNVQIIVQDGRVTGFQAVARDITEQKRAEEALRESESRLNAVLDNTSAVIYLKDAGGRFILVNRQFEKLFHVSRDHAKGKTDYDLFPKENADMFRANDKKVLESGVPEESEEVAPQDDGPHTYISVKFPLRNAAGIPYAVCGISTDISERKRAEEQMLKLNMELEQTVYELTFVNKELEAFSYSVSHDLRAPLRTINGYAQLLLHHQPNTLGEDAVRLLHVIRKNTQMMGQLIDDLLAFSHAGRRQMQTSLVDMGELAREVFEELVVTSPENKIQCTIRPLPPGYGDRAMLRQVFVNLLSNAIKFTVHRPEPAIEIGSTSEDGQQIYFVKDNGVGFDMQHAQKLFSVFERLHAQDEFEGTGVGLAIVQRVIQRHSGRVWAEGKVDAGATFYFSLPRVTKPA